MNGPDEIIELRHRLHTLAERSGEERQTAECVQQFLRGTKPDELLDGIGGNGIVAGWKGSEPGPTVILRCELDALPIPEENEIPWRSGDRSTGHKCGHDGHMAILCGVARLLEEQPPEKGEVHLLFQSAEETGRGAQQMLDTGVPDRIDPDFIFALHNLPGYEKGQIVAREGIFCAASTGLIVRFTGSTAHAAEPERGNNPAPAVANLVQALTSLPQYRLPIGRHAKVTIIHLRLGERAFGTTPGEAEVMATLRTYESGLLEELVSHARQLAEGIGQTYGLEVEAETVEDFTVTENDPDAVRIIAESAEENGFDLFRKREPFSWSEDFGRFTDRYPGAIFGLGSGRDHPPLHSSVYDFPDEIIDTGIAMFRAIMARSGVTFR